ncbi:MAG: hypothetical protein DWP92_11225, partial [Armatimonadetes bacterium]
MKRYLPELPARWCAAVGAATWLGVVLGLARPIALGVILSTVAAVGVILWRPAIVLIVFCALGVGSGWISAGRTAAIEAVELPTGRVEASLKVAEDHSLRSYGQIVAEIISLDGVGWGGPRVAVRNLPEDVTVGAVVVASGTMRDGVRRVRDEIVAGTFVVDAVIAAHPSGNPIVNGGNAVRNAVANRYNGDHVGDGLLSGFLTGDTDRMLAS